MIDKRPAAIARCADVDDRLGIDLSAMRGVELDASGRTLHMQGGATWADVDRVTAPQGLAARPRCWT